MQILIIIPMAFFLCLQYWWFSNTLGSAGTKKPFIALLNIALLAVEYTFTYPMASAPGNETALPVVIAVLTCALALLHPGSISLKALAVLFRYVITAFSAALTTLLLSLGGGFFETISLQNAQGKLLLKELIALGIACICFILALRLWRALLKNLKPGEVFSFLAVILLTFLGNNTDYLSNITKAAAGDDSTAINIIIGISTFVLTILLLTRFVFGYIRRLRNEEHVRNMQETLKANEQYEKEHAKYHEDVLNLHKDIQMHLDAIDLMLAAGNIDQAKDYIDKAGALAADTASKTYCDHSLLNGLIYSKEQEAEHQGFELKTEIHFPFLQHPEIGDVYYCSAFANLLDNAIEACEKNQGFGQTILLKAYSRAGFLFITVTNPYEHELKTSSSKDELWKHGKGLNILHSIANEFKGGFDLSQENGRVTAVLALSIDQPQVD